MSRDTGWEEDGAETALYIGRASKVNLCGWLRRIFGLLAGPQIYQMFLDRVDEIHVHNGSNLKWRSKISRLE